MNKLEKGFTKVNCISRQHIETTAERMVAAALITVERLPRAMSVTLTIKTHTAISTTCCVITVRVSKVLWEK